MTTEPELGMRPGPGLLLFLGQHYQGSNIKRLACEDAKLAEILRRAEKPLNQETRPFPP